MSGWTSKYLVEGDHSFKGKNVFDFIPEDVFFQTAYKLDWLDYVKWENVEAHYSVIKLDWPSEEEKKSVYGRRKKYKTTHAVCLNGIPIFQLFSYSEDRVKMWEWQEYDDRNKEWDMREAIIGDIPGYSDQAVHRLRVKYHNMANPDYGGSPEKVFAHQDRYSLNDYNEKTWWRDKLNMTINAFLWKRELILNRMQALVQNKIKAEKLGFPNLFYERVINPYQYPSDMNQGKEWDKLSLQERQQKKADRENPEDHLNEQMSTFEGIIRFALASLSKIGKYHTAQLNPTTWKRFCRFLNALSTREWKRYNENKLGIVNHSVISPVPILKVEQALKILNSDDELLTNTILPIKEGETEDTAVDAVQIEGLDTGKWWAGMLLNGFNYYSSYGTFCFTDQATKIRRHRPWSGFGIYAFENKLLWEYVETDMVKKTNQYPKGASSKDGGVLPPFVYKK